MEQFFKELTGKIEEAVREDIKIILQETSGEKIYAAALVTDSDCITLFLAVNTYEYMEKKDREYLEMLQGDLTEEEIKNVREGTASLTKWIPDEWGYSDGEDSGLVNISELLYNREESDPEAYEKHAELFFQAVTDAFKHLIDEKVFGDDAEDITYFISMSDDERTPEIENYSAKLLNSEAVYQAFLNRTPDI